MKLNLNDVQFTYKNLYELYDMHLFSSPLSYVATQEQPFIDLYLDYLDTIEKHLIDNYSTHVHNKVTYKFSTIESYFGVIHAGYRCSEISEVLMLKLHEL